jgi:Holliday junction resolvase-like predicted endonuclease
MRQSEEKVNGMEKTMLKAAEVGIAGERHAVAWLRTNGWQCYRNTQLPGATDIEATQGRQSILVQVKTAVYPNSAASPSAEEKKAIVARAGRNQCEAWLAQLQIDNEGRLLGKITWTKLT